MKVRLAYGAGGLEVELPDERTTVVEPAYHAGADDERAVLLQALREPVAGPPLRGLARPGQSVAISICDGTRPDCWRYIVEVREGGLPADDTGYR